MNNKIKQILILPCNTSEAMAYATQQQAAGHRIIGASSLPIDNTARYYDQHIKVPWLTSDEFDSAVLSIFNAEKIDEVFVPQFEIYERIKSIKIENDFPFILKTLAEEYEKSNQLQAVKDRANDYLGFVNIAANQPIPHHILTSLLSHFIAIPGNCSEDKFCALIQAGLSFPEGDLVEIGSFYGKSAFVLGWMAKWRNIGKLLCVDPWEHAIPQKDVHPVLKNRKLRRDPSTTLARFVNNLLPYLVGHVNCLHKTSDEAYPVYRDNRLVESPHFGVTQYCGKIACLHIDGNHDVDYVTRDITQWGAHLVPGAWVIFDDYFWCYGDGPKVAADKYIRENSDDIACAFACGGALFLQKKG